MSVINRAQSHNQALEGAVNSLVGFGKHKVHDPVTDGVLNIIGKGTRLVAAQDTFNQSVSSYKSISQAKGVLGKVGAVASNYDHFVATKVDKASTAISSSGYYATKMALSILTGTVISRFRLGRIIQEGLATLVGLSLRTAGKVIEIALRILPYAAMATGLAFGGAKAALGMIALYGISKALFVGAIGGAALVSFAAYQLSDMHGIKKAG